MPDSQSNEPGFESLFATVSKIGHFRSLHWHPCSFSCINEYLAVDSGGNVSDLALARNCCLATMLPGEAELVSEWTGLPGEAKSVKRFERSTGPDTALYKNYLYLFFNFRKRSRKLFAILLKKDTGHIDYTEIESGRDRERGMVVKWLEHPNGDGPHQRGLHFSHDFNCHVTEKTASFISGN